MKILISCINHSCEQGVLDVVKQIIFDLSKPPHISYKILVLDNSEDDLKDEKFFQELVEIFGEDKIKNPSNHLSMEHEIIHIMNSGFGGGHNKALDIAEAENFDVTWVVDPDIRFDRNCLKSLVMNFDSQYSILGSKICEEKLTYLGTDGLSSWRSYRHPRGTPTSDNLLRVDAVIGASMFIKTASISDLRFDENYFMYVEENDFCNEANKRGLKVATDINSILWHEGGKSLQHDTARIWYYKTRNLYFFRRKNGMRSGHLMVYLFVTTLVKHKCNPKFLVAYFLGVLDYLNGKFGNTGRIFT